MFKDCYLIFIIMQDNFDMSTQSDIAQKDTSFSYNMTGKTNILLHIKKRSDIIIFDGITIQHCNIEHITSLNVLIGGSIIWNIPFKILMNISTVTDCGK